MIHKIYSREAHTLESFAKWWGKRGMVFVMGLGQGLTNQWNMCCDSSHCHSPYTHHLLSACSPITTIHLSYLHAMTYSSCHVIYMIYICGWAWVVRVWCGRLRRCLLKDMPRLGIELRTSWLYTKCFNQLSHRVLLDRTWIVLHIVQYAPNNTVSTCSNPETSNLQT